MERKTPLYEKHAALGGRLVPFAGWLLPVQYKTGIIAEHNAVRQAAGLFDVSHMGELWLEGPDALASLQHLLTNDYADLQPGFVRYSPMCNERGGVVDDLLVYKFTDTKYLIVVNASNREKDAAHIAANLTGDCRMTDRSDETAQLALQGQAAERILAKLCDADSLPGGYYTFRKNVSVAGKTCLVSRTGYTGEDGFELYCANDDAPILWDALLEAGAADGLIPCGLGARDSLRAEAAMPLYGHEMDDVTPPTAAGLGYFVKTKAKTEFIGREALLSMPPLARKRAGIVISGRGIPRNGDPVLANGREIGTVTTGVHSPTLGRPVAMAMLDVAEIVSGAAVVTVSHGRELAGELVKLPFYKRK